MDSDYFVDDPGNWHLKEGAPQDIVNEFNEFIQGDEAPEVQPTTIIELD